MLSTLRALCAALHRARAACTVATVGDGENVPDATVMRFAPSRPRRLSASLRLKAWLAENAAHFDAIVAHGLWLSPTRYAFAAAQTAKRPFFLRPAGMLDPDALAHHPLRKTLRWWLGERGMVRKARLLFSTEEDRARAALHLKLDLARCHVVANAVADAFFNVQREASSPPLILCLNRLHERKGVREWVQALTLLAKRGLSFRALHAGTEENAGYAASCRTLARGLPLEFAGVVSEGRVRELMGQAALLVHPTVGFENFGMVVAEALAAGVPVAASRRALVVPQLERAGLIDACEPTPAELALAAERALAAPAARCAAGRDYARANFGADAVGRRLLSLFDSVR